MSCEGIIGFVAASLVRAHRSSGQFLRLVCLRASRVPARHTRNGRAGKQGSCSLVKERPSCCSFAVPSKTPPVLSSRDMAWQKKKDDAAQHCTFPFRSKTKTADGPAIVRLAAGSGRDPAEDLGKPARLWARRDALRTRRTQIHRHCGHGSVNQSQTNQQRGQPVRRLECLRL